MSNAAPASNKRAVASIERIAQRHGLQVVVHDPNARRRAALDAAVEKLAGILQDFSSVKATIVQLGLYADAVEKERFKQIRLDLEDMADRMATEARRLV